MAKPFTSPVRTAPSDATPIPPAPIVAANRMMTGDMVWVRSRSRQPVRHSSGVLLPGGRALLREGEVAALGAHVQPEE